MKYKSLQKIILFCVPYYTNSKEVKFKQQKKYRSSWIINDQNKRNIVESNNMRRNKKKINSSEREFKISLFCNK